MALSPYYHDGMAPKTAVIFERTRVRPRAANPAQVKHTAVATLTIATALALSGCSGTVSSNEISEGSPGSGSPGPDGGAFQPGGPVMHQPTLPPPADPGFDPSSGRYDPDKACGELAMPDPAIHHGHHAHSDDSSKAGEHSAAMQLLLAEDASHVAAQSGYWGDANTWQGGQIPGADADVFIPAGVCVIYHQESDVVLHYVRVEGGIVFSSHDNSKMVVDTLVGAVGSLFKAGAVNDPVDPSVRTEIVFADNGPIDLADDPDQLSRGLVLHGTVSMHGAPKAAFLPLDLSASSGAKRLEAGSTELPLLGDASNWQVGDRLVVMGTAKGEYQDEERHIAAINGNTVTLDAPLSHLHDTPRFQTDNVSGISELHIYVGNATRNVTFRSAYTGMDDVKRRGHFMVMHADGADVRYAGFHDMGRTDKRIPIDDAYSRIVLGRMPGTRNPEGRYPLHFHRTGVGPTRRPFACIGNAVTGSPGWGITHHDSYGAVNHNFVYDIIGAGIVSEDSNEAGEWIGNFVTSIYGDGGRHGDGGDGGRGKINQTTVQTTGDAGFAGVAYESQSRIITQQDNIAANAEVGWSFMGINPNRGHDNDNNDTNSPEQPYNKHPEIITAFPPDPLQVQYYHHPVKVMGAMGAQFMQFSGNEMIAIERTGLTSWHRSDIGAVFALINQLKELRVWRVGRALNYSNYHGGYHQARCLFVEVGTVNFSQEKTMANSFVSNHLERVGNFFNFRGINDGAVAYNNTEVDVDHPLDGTTVFAESPQVLRVPAASVVQFDYPRAEISPIGDFSAYENMSQPTLRLEEDSLAVGPRTGFSLRGTITDRFGERPFVAGQQFFSNGVHGAESGTLRTAAPGSPGENGWLFPGGKFRQYSKGSIPWEVVLDLYGVIQKDGRWVMPIPIWINDLGTGEPYPILYDFEVKGASDDDLRDHTLDAYPSVDLTGIYYGNPNINSDGSFKPTRVYAREAWRVPVR